MNKGQSTLEYAVIIMLVGILIVLIIWAIGATFAKVPADLSVNIEGARIFAQVMGWVP